MKQLIHNIDSIDYLLFEVTIGSTDGIKRMYKRILECEGILQSEEIIRRAGMAADVKMGILIPFYKVSIFNVQIIGA